MTSKTSATKTRPKRGKFIVFEGIDGSGKSSLMEAAHEFLQKRGIEVFLTRQPGGSPIGEKIRTILKESAPSLQTEALLFAASFAESLNTLINPILKKGTWVVSDRWTDSMRAYQCGGRGLPEKEIEQIIAFASPQKPDLTILCDPDPRTAERRLRSRGEKDKFEVSLTFQKRVSEYYRAHYGPRTRFIDTGRFKQETCTAAIQDILSEQFFKK